VRFYFQLVSWTHISACFAVFTLYKKQYGKGRLLSKTHAKKHIDK